MSQRQESLGDDDDSSDEVFSPPGTPPPSRMSIDDPDEMSYPITQMDINRYIMGHHGEPKEKIEPKDTGPPGQGRFTEIDENTPPVGKPKINTLIQAEKEEVVYSCRPRSSSFREKSPVNPERVKVVRSKRPQSERRSKSVGSTHESPELSRNTISSRIENIFSQQEDLCPSDEEKSWWSNLRHARMERHQHRQQAYDKWWNDVKDTRHKVRHKRPEPNDGLTLAERILLSRGLGPKSKRSPTPVESREEPASPAATSRNATARSQDSRTSVFTDTSYESELARLNSPEVRQSSPASPVQEEIRDISSRKCIRSISVPPKSPEIIAGVEVSDRRLPPLEKLERSETFHGVESKKHSVVKRHEKRPKTASPTLPIVEHGPVINVKQNAFARSPSRTSYQSMDSTAESRSVTKSTDTIRSSSRSEDEEAKEVESHRYDQGVVYHETRHVSHERHVHRSDVVHNSSESKRNREVKAEVNKEEKSKKKKVPTATLR